MKNSGATSGKHSVDSVQKTAVLETSHLTRKYCILKLGVGITVGSGEAPERKRDKNKIIIIIIPNVTKPNHTLY
jgi:hypothetical protein